MQNPLLGLPGAVQAGDDGVAAHYGQPVKEARLLDEGEAFVDLSHRGVITITGPDRLSWLDSMTSQLVRTLEPGESAETLLLTPQGRVEQHLRVVDDGERTWLLVDAGRAEATVAFLARMRFALRVEVQDVSAEYAQVGVFAGAARDTVASQIAPVVTWHDPWAEVQRGGFAYSAPREVEWTHTVFVCAREQLETLRELVETSEVRISGTAALRALEIHAWRVGTEDVDERTIPHELDWVRTAVHLTKGCYRGQETVAKVHNLGRPPRRITMLHVDGSEGETPEPGALVYATGVERPVGRVTRSALHHEWGVIALAMLKRSLDPHATLDIELASGGRASATQEVIVAPDAGATKDLPKLRRL